MDRAPVITVDGPSGTGKGTLSSYLREILGWKLLDSGALYRILGYVALRDDISLGDVLKLVEVLDIFSPEFVEKDGTTKVLLDNKDVSDAIRAEEVGSAASQLATSPYVRKALLARQRAFRVPPGLVADGRDMGTVVFPSAELKIFLTASIEERVRRRYKQLKQKGMGVSLARLREEVTARDKRDEGRKLSPLRPAPDAIIIDTTFDDISTVENRVSALVVEKGFVVNNIGDEERES